MGGTIIAARIRIQWNENAVPGDAKKARLDERVAHGAKAPQLSRQNEMTVALRNIGQIERPLFSLEWLQDVELRRPRPRPAQ
jgi:TnpA family transposase